MLEKKIQIETVNRGVAKVTPFILSKTTNTKVGFEPTIHEHGITGKLVKYKKSSSKQWEELKKSDFSSHALSTMEQVTIRLDTEAIETFRQELNMLSMVTEKDIESGQKKYVITEEGKAIVINDMNKLSILKQILNEGHSDEYWKLIAESQPDLAKNLAAGYLQKLRAATVGKLKHRLTEKHPETNGPTSWQRWIFDNNWLFGVNYLKPIEKQKLNLKGVMPDFLFPRIDGFVDLLEIKLPTEEVIICNNSHPGSYRWNGTTATAIGQVVSYLSEIERLQLEIEREIGRNHDKNISMVKPRAYILIGNSANWPIEKLEGLRKLNGYLHGIEVLTYQDLIHRGEAFLSGSNYADALENHEDEIPF